MARAFEPDHEGINKLARAAGTRAVLVAYAEEAKGIADALSEDFRDTGDYIRSFQVSQDTIEWIGEYPGRRGAAILSNTSDHALAVEFGNAHNRKPHHVLQRTLDTMADG